MTIKFDPELAAQQPAARMSVFANVIERLTECARERWSEAGWVQVRRSDLLELLAFAAGRAQQQSFPDCPPPATTGDGEGSLFSAFGVQIEAKDGSITYWHEVFTTREDAARMVNISMAVADHEMRPRRAWVIPVEISWRKEKP